jgi:hypothetical protein
MACPSKATENEDAWRGFVAGVGTVLQGLEAQGSTSVSAKPVGAGAGSASGAPVPDAKREDKKEEGEDAPGN